MDHHYIKEIEPGLYIGSLRSLGYVELHGITHVLTVVNFGISRDMSDVTWLRLPLRDDEDTNLLVHLPAAYNFIHNALTGKPMTPTVQNLTEEDADDTGDPPNDQYQIHVGSNLRNGPPRVLIHCHAGVSRSVSVMTAYLMKAHGIDDTEALELIRKNWPNAEPNEGFRAQLGLFYDMHYSLNPEHPVYKLWCLQQVGKRWEEEGWVDTDVFAKSPDDTKAANSTVALFRCRKCRHMVASSKNVVPVNEVASGHKIFRRKHASVTSTPQTGSQDADSAGSSLFLEPMDWMANTVVGIVQGKLYCPGCNARLGSFNWSGITNEAGLWITPAFQVHTNKLDVLQPAKPLSAMGIRTPKVGPAASLNGMNEMSQTQTAGALANTNHSTTASTNNQSITASPYDSITAESGSSTLPAMQQVDGVMQTSQAAVNAVQVSGNTNNVNARTAWFHTLVLDCDGVLVDSERASCESLRRAILEVTGFDIPHTFPEDYTEVFGMDVKGCVTHYKAKFNKVEWHDVDQISAQVVVVKEKKYQELTQELGLTAFPGAKPLIKKARDLGMAIGIGSSGAPSKIAHNLSSSGLVGLVAEQHIVSAAYVARGKPAPDVYIEVLRRLGCTEPRRAIVVEDAVNGLKAAKGAGAFTVAVTTSLPAVMLKPWADLVLDDLGQLVDMLEHLTQMQGS